MGVAGEPTAPVSGSGSAAPFVRLGHALPHLLSRDEIEASQLVVGAEIPPGGTLGPLLPS